MKLFFSVPSFFLLDRFQQISMGDFFSPKLFSSVDAAGHWYLFSLFSLLFKQKRKYSEVRMGYNWGQKNSGPKSELETLVLLTIRREKQALKVG